MKGKEQKICHECGGVMVPCTTSKTLRYLGKEIEIKGLECYLCNDCGERVFSSQEVKMIESLMKAFSEIQVPKVDVLNLEETAEFLRVSNQTVYNMIRDGRIKAYKAGREWRILHSDILAYMNSSANNAAPLMAAKGGIINEVDLEIIRKEIEQRKE